jgi:hypothetical protein
MRKMYSVAVRVSLLVILLVLSSPGPAVAQPVERRLPVVVFQVETEAGGAAAQRCLEIWMQEGPRLASNLLPVASLNAPRDTVICLVVNTESFQRHFAGRLPDWGVGVALPSGRVIAVDYSRLPAVGRGLREVFLHEMVHALLFLGADGAWLPVWLHEGAAMLYSGEWKFSDTVSLILDGHVPSLESLQGRFPIPHDRADRAYRTSLLAVSRLREGFGEEIVVDLVRETKKSENFPAAFALVTGQDLNVFHRDFASAMKLKYGWMLFLTRWPGLFVLAALIFAVGATRKIIIMRRRMAAMEDVEDPSVWPETPDSHN